MGGEGKVPTNWFSGSWTLYRDVSKQCCCFRQESVACVLQVCAWASGSGVRACRASSSVTSLQDTSTRAAGEAQPHIYCCSIMQEFSRLWAVQGEQGEKRTGSWSAVARESGCFSPGDMQGSVRYSSSVLFEVLMQETASWCLVGETGLLPVEEACRTNAGIYMLFNSRPKAYSCSFRVPKILLRMLLCEKVALCWIQLFHFSDAH